MQMLLSMFSSPLVRFGDPALNPPASRRAWKGLLGAFFCTLGSSVLGKAPFVRLRCHTQVLGKYPFLTSLLVRVPREEVIRKLYASNNEDGTSPKTSGFGHILQPSKSY